MYAYSQTFKDCKGRADLSTFINQKGAIRSTGWANRLRHEPLVLQRGGKAKLTFIRHLFEEQLGIFTLSPNPQKRCRHVDMAISYNFIDFQVLCATESPQSTGVTSIHNIGHTYSDV